MTVNFISHHSSLLSITLISSIETKIIMKIEGRTFIVSGGYVSLHSNDISSLQTTGHPGLAEHVLRISAKKEASQLFSI